MREYGEGQLQNKPLTERNAMPPKGRPQKLYLVLDTETATMPFVSEWNLSAEQKKKVAIMKPLIYDIGWTICNRKGEILERKNYLISETFAVPSIFQTAYYREKRPLYLQKMRNKEITLTTWDLAIAELLNDMEKVEAFCAYNVGFDRCAIAFTENYIAMLYSAHYEEWERGQRVHAWNVAQGIETSSRKEYNRETIELRNRSYPIIDLWGAAVSMLLNTNRFRSACLEHKWISNSGEYFSTSAETTYRFLLNEYGFEEEHTALSDAEIESAILGKCAARGALPIGITDFPFKLLGKTQDYLHKSRAVLEEYAETVIDKMQSGIENRQEGSYKTRIENEICRLKTELDLGGE